MKELGNWGYELRYNKRGDVRYLSSPDVLFPHEISFGRESAVFGFNIYSFDRVDSTNTVAQKYAARGEGEGTLIIADRQTAGRGRLGRSWHSPPGTGVYMSLILKPEIAPAAAPGLSLIAAVSVAEAVRSLTKVKASIKWPNDVLYGSRKLAGVLTELDTELDRVRHVIVGIGVNVNMEASDFPEELKDKATSLRILTGKPVDRVRLVQTILDVLEARYQSFCRDGLRGQIKKIRSLSAILGKRIRFTYNRKVLEGIAEDIDGNGQLLVRLNKELFAISSGEITLAENY